MNRYENGRLAVPFSLVGAVWLLYLLGYNMSIGIWAGIIALLGVDAETGVIMLLYLDLAFEERRKKRNLHFLHHGASCLPGRLSSLEMAQGSQAETGTVIR
ncbi:MAG: hypothetical protein QHH14_09530 [Clostridiales bacterium]|nr:hypothetical protein [Clostridiales bacterium]